MCVMWGLAVDFLDFWQLTFWISNCVVPSDTFDLGSPHSGYGNFSCSFFFFFFNVFLFCESPI